MTNAPISIFLCPSCEAGFDGHRDQIAIECHKCRYRFQRPENTVFGEIEWSRETEPALMELCRLTTQQMLPLTPRKARLLCTAVARTCSDQWGIEFQHMVCAAEEWADAGQPRFGVDDLIRYFQRKQAEWRRRPDFDFDDWNRISLALACLARAPTPLSDDIPHSMRSQVPVAYRELFPNPFLPLIWNPDWFVSTVRDLAAHIYATREFGTMPILADALQDAGCDNDYILNHCRAEKPHARGCWVLDAILGKT